MNASCQNCSNRFFVPGDGTVGLACPDCGGELRPERDQPSPTQSDGELRDMADSHGDDMGGNPLREGILGDWQNRDKRDESFASVHASLQKKAFPKIAAPVTYPYDGSQIPDPRTEEAANHFSDAERIYLEHGWEAAHNYLTQKMDEHHHKYYAPHGINEPTTPVDVAGFGHTMREQHGGDAPSMWHDRKMGPDLGQTEIPEGHQLNWTPGQRGRGIFVGPNLHTWNADGPMHGDYIKGLGIDPSQVDFNTGVEIGPDGTMDALTGRDLSQHQAVDPRLKSGEELWGFDSSFKPSATIDQSIRQPWWIQAAEDPEFSMEDAEVVPPGGQTIEAIPHPGKGIHNGPVGALHAMGVTVNGEPAGEQHILHYSPLGQLTDPELSKWEENKGRPVMLSHDDPQVLDIARQVVEAGEADPFYQNHHVVFNTHKDQANVHPVGFTQDVIKGLGNLDAYVNDGRVRHTYRDLLGQTPEGPVTIGAKSPEELAVAKKVLESGSSNPAREYSLRKQASKVSFDPLNAIGDAADSVGNAASDAGNWAWNHKAAVGTGLAVAGTALLAVPTGGASLAAIPEEVGAGAAAGGAAAGAEALGAGAEAAGVQAAKTGALSTLMNGARAKGGQVLSKLSPGGVVKGLGKYEAMNLLFGHRDGGLLGDLEGGQQAGPQQDSLNQLGPPRTIQELARVADHPNSVDTIGPDFDAESVDPHEINDGDHSNWGYDPSVNDGGGTDAYSHDSPIFNPKGEGYQKVQKHLDHILKWYYHPESGEHDPIISDVHQTLEHEKPGYSRFGHPSNSLIIMSNTPKQSAIPDPNLPLGAGQTALQQNMQTQPASSVCPGCNGVLSADGSCPQCGYGTQPQGVQNTVFNPGHVPNPNQFASSVHAQLTKKAAPHGGPQNAEQIAAVVQLLVDEGRAEEAPLVSLYPERFAKELAQIQRNPNLPPDDPTTPGQVPAQPIEQTPPNANMPMPGMSADPAQMQPTAKIAAALQRYTSDNLAPKCPKCESHTTGLINTRGDCRCHACGNIWTETGSQDDLHKSKVAAPPPPHTIPGPSFDAPTTLQTCPRCGWYGPMSDVCPHCQTDLAPLPQDLTHRAADENVIDVPIADQRGPGDPAKEDRSGIWKTTGGEPLHVGNVYKLVNPQYQIPDIIRIEAVKPDSIDFVIEGLQGVSPRDSVTRDEFRTFDMHIDPYDADAPEDDDQNSQDASVPTQAPPAQSTEPSEKSHNFPLQGSVKEACAKCSSDSFSSDMLSPTETSHECYKCGHKWVEHDNDEDVKTAGILPEDTRSWLKGGTDTGAFPTITTNPELATEGTGRNLKEIAAKNRYAGYNYTQTQQRALIDESGTARNIDKLELDGTHYRLKDPDKGDAWNVPDDHIGLGVMM